jgi:hypothetical protein
MRIYQHALSVTCIACFITLGTWSGNALSDDTCLILDFGLFTKDTGQINFNDKQGVNARSQQFKVEQLRETTKVPLLLGTHFGFSYKVNTDALQQSKELIFRANHPEMTDPKTNEVKTSYVFSATKPTNNISFFGFSFDDEYELVEGDWLFQIISENGVMCQKGFKVSANY